MADAKLGRVPNMLRAKPVPCRPTCLSGRKFWWATAERSSLPPPLSTLNRTEVADLRKQRAHEKLPFNTGREFGVSVPPRDYVREGSATRGRWYSDSCEVHAAVYSDSGDQYSFIGGQAVAHMQNSGASN